MSLNSPRAPSELPLLDDHEVPANSQEDLTSRPPPSRAKYLWTRVRNVSRILGRLNKMLSDIQTFGVARKEFSRESLQDGVLAAIPTESKWVLRPEMGLMKHWSLFMIFLMMYTATITPYRVCFVEEVTGSWLVVDIITDVMFGVDICLTFFSAYEENDATLVTNRTKIAKKYLKSWFLLDVLGCLPINYISLSSQDSTSTGDTYNRLFRLLRLPRLYRLIRVFRLMKMVRVFRSNSLVQRLLNTLKVNSGILRLLRFGATIVILVHVSGCFWYLLARLEDSGPDTWVARYGYSGASNIELYIMSIYYVFTTLTTVGFGDIAANTVSERVFAVILMGFGVGFYSYTISNLSTIMENIDLRSSHLKTRLSTLNDFSKDSNLPRNLKTRIRRHIVHDHEQNIYSWFSHDSLLKDLPAALRTEISQYLHRDIVQKVIFFQDKDPGFIAFVLPNLRNLAFKCGEVIFQQGEHADEVYFLLEGRVGYKTAQGAVLLTYVQGSYFGEVDILENVSRAFTAQVSSKVAELLVLTKANLLKMMEEFPDIALEVIETAREKQQRNEKATKDLAEIFQPESPQAKLRSATTKGIEVRKFHRRSSLNDTINPLERGAFTVNIMRSADTGATKEAYWDKLKEKYGQPEPLLSLSQSPCSETPDSPHTHEDRNEPKDFTAQAMPLFSPESPNGSPKSHLDAIVTTLKEKEQQMEEQFAVSGRLMGMIAKRQGDLRHLVQAIAAKRGKIS